MEKARKSPVTVLGTPIERSANTHRSIADDIGTVEKDFVHALELVNASIPNLEYIYTMLSSGSSNLPVGEQQEMLDTCADELYAAYQLQEVFQRYKMISEITS